MVISKDFLTQEQRNLKKLDFKEKGHEGVRHELLLNAAKKAKTAERAVEYAPTSYKPFILKKWWPQLDLEQKKILLYRSWKYCNTVAFFGYDQWLKLFDETGFIEYCDIPKPIEPVKVYRGCTPGFRNGMSWTPDLEVAKWFNERFEDPRGISRVYETVIQPEWILATVEAVNEDVNGILKVREYVIDPRFLELEFIVEVNLYNTENKTHRPTRKFSEFAPYLKMKKGKGIVFENEEKSRI